MQPDADSDRLVGAAAGVGVEGALNCDCAFESAPSARESEQESVAASIVTCSTCAVSAWMFMTFAVYSLA